METNNAMQFNASGNLNEAKHGMYSVFDKLYLARWLLSLNKKDMAKQAGITQMAISLLEHGERKNLPADYIKFLYEQGIDINWLFSDNNDISLAIRKNFHESFEENFHEIID